MPPEKPLAEWTIYDMLVRYGSIIDRMAAYDTTELGENRRATQMQNLMIQIEDEARRRDKLAAGKGDDNAPA